jgi:hypothetical protein
MPTAHAGFFTPINVGEEEDRPLRFYSQVAFLDIGSVIEKTLIQRGIQLQHAAAACARISRVRYLGYLARTAHVIREAATCLTCVAGDGQWPRNTLKGDSSAAQRACQTSNHLGLHASES